MLSTALTFVVLASAAGSTGLPNDPRAPAAASEEDPIDFFADLPVVTDETAPARAPAPKAAPRPAAAPAPRAAIRPALESRIQVRRGAEPSRFATLEILQAELPEQWDVALDGANVGRLAHRDDRLRAAMVTPGTHRLRLYNRRGTLWSGQVTVRAGQTLVLETRRAGLTASDPMAVRSEAELRQDRVARRAGQAR